MNFLIFFGNFYLLVVGYKEKDYEWRMGYGKPEKQDKWKNVASKKPIEIEPLERKSFGDMARTTLSDLDLYNSQVKLMKKQEEWFKQIQSGILL